VLLLRATVAALRAAGHGVSVLAPSAAGGALVGPGAGEVDAALPWEAAAVASLLDLEGPIAPEIARALSPFQAVVAYTGNAALAHALKSTGAEVIAHPPLPPEGGPHAGRWLAQAVAVLAADPATVPPTMQPTEGEDERARAWRDRLGPAFLAVHPGSGSPRKNWPAERFAAVVETLAGGRPWLLVEGPADAEAARPLFPLAGAVHAREIPPRVLGAVLARAGLYVGNDSGVSHLAAAWGAPTLALFGPTDARQWAPVGPKVTVLASGDATMAGLSVDEVVRKAREIV
jgi:Glycosyltransferase family 9 (heptosyltransferase)